LLSRSGYEVEGKELLIALRWNWDTYPNNKIILESILNLVEFFVLEIVKMESKNESNMLFFQEDAMIACKTRR